MKKKIAILILRNNELKLFLPVIQEMLSSESMIPVLVTSKTINTDTKKMQNYNVSFNPFHNRMDVYYINNINEIVTLLANHKIDILLTASILLNILEKMKEQKIRVIYLQHSMDMIATWPKLYNLEFFQLMDGFLCFSQYWKDGMIRELEKQLNIGEDDINKIKAKTHAVGMPELDQIKTFNKEAILEKYKLPTSKKKIVFFDPVGVVTYVPNYFYKYYFCLYGSKREKLKRTLKNLIVDVRTSPKMTWKIPISLLRILKRNEKISTYETLFSKLKKFCHENDYLLICKSKEKNNDPDFVKYGCDFFTYDMEYLPFTLLEMLFISDVYIGFNSSAVMEAVYCNLPVISFHVFPTDYQFNDYGGDVYLFIEKWLNTSGEWLNYRGINQVYRWDQDETNFVNAINNFALDPQSRHDYITKFIGYNGMSSSGRVLNVLENHYL